MSKMTYREQLLHPFWQRRRLEVLQRDGFACADCGDKEKTLHVHHKRYIKGRMAWDYDNSDLVSLCKDCHEANHEAKELVEREIAAVESFELPIVHALLVGYRGGLVASEGVPEQFADSTLMPGNGASKAYWIGTLARVLSEALTAEEAADLFLHTMTLGEAGHGVFQVVSAAAAVRVAAHGVYGGAT